MRSILAALAALVLAGSLARAQTPADPQRDEIVNALEKLSTRLAADPARDELRGMLGRALREQIIAANQRSSAEWRAVDSREAWERFRAGKLRQLRESLGTFPPRPSSQPSPPKVLVTREIAGEGFKIRNLVYQSRPGLVVTANLYVPDPPPADSSRAAPGILLSHSHHNPKHEGELQDMGMTWARAGCYVLVPDHLGHGERRQHPFATAADYSGSFQVGRQDYNFRYDTSLQLYLAGESLMGWMVHDLMTGVDVLLAQPGIDPARIALLGAVAGGGDPAGVTAALDERIACVVPFNFGGPQPENRFPLPEDAETSFNYAGSGSWESTRNLRNSAADGFLPWVIVGSVAPRKLIHAHEFSWDQERDPVWKRYQKIWGFYDAADNLAFTHGFGTIQNTRVPASHCNNIGPEHRRRIHEAFRRWLAIDVGPDDEYQKRRSREELTCLTDAAREEFRPLPLHKLLAKQADQQMAAFREQEKSDPADKRRDSLRDHWTRLLGETDVPAGSTVRAGSKQVESIGPLTVTRELLETDPGIVVPIVTLSATRHDGQPRRWRPVILGFATDGIEPILKRRQADLASGLKTEILIVLVEPRGTGASSPGNDRGQQSAAAAHSATSLMLGDPLLAGQLRDLRAAWQHIQDRADVRSEELIIAGGTGVAPLAAGATFAYPRRIDGRPAEADPSGALLALLLGLFEDETIAINARLGLVSYRSVLDSPYVQVPHEAILPGALAAGDLPALVSALAPREVGLEGLVDGHGRRVPTAKGTAEYVPATKAYAEAGAAKALQFEDEEP
jgi:dienelactone hydrolase